MNIKVVILPGRYGKPHHNWFPYVQRKLAALDIEVVNIEFPTPTANRARTWLNFIETLGTDENTILIGHSSGAVAALRYAETHRILGSILVAACQSHLGDEEVKASGYFDTLWDWKAIKTNQQWIVQYASTDDPHIPISEAHIIRNALGSTYYEYDDQGHFGKTAGKIKFPEIIQEIKKRIL